MTFSVDDSDFQKSMDALIRGLPKQMDSALDRVLNEIAALAKTPEMSPFTDRSGLLRASIQSAGAEGDIWNDTLQGTVSFAAESGSAEYGEGTGGYLYGIALEFGTEHIQEGKWLNVRKSMDQILGSTDAFDRALDRALNEAGFQ